MTRRLVAALLTLASVAFAAEPAKAPAPARPAVTGPLLVGLVASTNAKVAEGQAAALAGWVKGTLQKEAREKVFADYDTLVDALQKGEIDLALMGPLAYQRLDKKAKATPLFRTTRHGQATYRSVLFAKPNSPLKDLEAVRKAKGLKVGWVDVSSATGYILPKAQLMLSGIDPVQVFTTQDFAGTHDAVCQGVMEGKFDVGATFSEDPPSQKVRANGCEGALGKKADSLTIITSTGEIPTDALVARGGFPQDLADKLKEHAKKLASTEPGKKMVQAAFLADGIADVSDADYEPVRKAMDAFKR